MTPLGDADLNRQKSSSTARGDSSYLEGTENTHSTKHGITTSKKRKSDAIEEHEGPPEVDDDDPRLYEINDTCNEIRRKIKDFIQGGNMKVGEFQEAIGVSSTAYQRFMNQNGTYKGQESDTYLKASAFFKKRELQGLKAAPPKRPRKSDSKALDTGDIKLGGEDTQSVKVHDTCDEIRKKIRAFLRKPHITRSAFCRAIGESFPEHKQISPRQLKAFLDKKGSMSGNTSPVFYGAYVFFEKLRIKEGKPKSEMRLEMEKIHPRGLNTTELENRFLCKDNVRPTHDKYGRICFIRVQSLFVTPVMSGT
ncbi:uncharacterized protein F4812DRAFT_411810 [Daldinia caldariorum]|uniref:uncharacterized protein n=1 Tax=Daldinia caldariorum TaxID=326644 RepID=UPI002008C752|nr:uncharacterized protein F4812DRAFT_411810 [Daldinia caldariorum]KAI1473162.1 hypothetical protein F4812DRAFT_411810 [Daldinia caldariorum]